MKKSHIITYGVTILLTLISYTYFAEVMVGGKLSLYQHSYHLFALVLIILPFLFEIIFKKELPLLLVIAYLIFVWMAQVLGFAYSAYTTFANWDNIVHAYGEFLLVLAFAWCSKPVMENTSVVYQVLYLVGVGILGGVIWEIIEFTGDEWFGTNNQTFIWKGVMQVGHNAVKDTMIDLIIDLIGIGLAVGLVYSVKYYNKNRRAKNEKNI